MTTKYLILILLSILFSLDAHSQFTFTYEYKLQKYESKSDSYEKGKAILINKGDSSLFMDRAQWIKDTTSASKRFQNASRELKVSEFLALDRAQFNYKITIVYL